MEIAWEAIITSVIIAFMISFGLVCTAGLIVFAASVAFWTTLLLFGVIVFIVSFVLLLRFS